MNDIYSNPVKQLTALQQYALRAQSSYVFEAKINAVLLDCHFNLFQLANDQQSNFINLLNQFEGFLRVLQTAK